MTRARILVLLAALPMIIACGVAEPPPAVHVLVLEGGPYERGLQHGRELGAHIRSLYTRLLESSILPYLNREQLNIAPILTVYGQPAYRDGQFSYRMLLESGRHLFDHHLPEAYRQELQGIADGAGLPFDQVLVLNTFLDTMMAFRAVVLFIQYIQEPYVESIAAADGTFEERIEPYGSLPHAALVEVPAGARIRIVLRDPTLPGLACVDPRNAEPLGDLGIDPACLQERCILDACADEELVTRDCLAPAALSCIAPRVTGDCLVPGCVEPTDPGRIDPGSVRIQSGGELYLASDPAVAIREIPDEPDALEVTFRPPGGFPLASAVAITVTASDMSPIYSPEPLHARTMRDERFVFTTEGFGALAGDVPNRYAGAAGRPRPPPVAFAARDKATPDGSPLLAHHFTLLDSDIVHEHAVLFHHLPEDGHPHALLGWAGVCGGFSGMNDQGLAYAVNHSDTLDNPLVGRILTAMFEPENLAKLIARPDLAGLAEVLTDTRLTSAGLPVGIAGRELLARAATVDEGIDLLYRTGRTYGWSFLLVDAAGELAAVELDAASQSDESGTSPAPADEDGFALIQPGSIASVGEDDLRIASHFVKNEDDMEEFPLLSTFSPRPQRLWSGLYFRSLTASHLLADRIGEMYGDIDVAGAIGILRTSGLVDRQDSMNAGVFEPAVRRLHWAMGGVPATEQEFVPFDLFPEEGP